MRVIETALDVISSDQIVKAIPSRNEDTGDAGKGHSTVPHAIAKTTLLSKGAHNGDTAWCCI